MKNSNFGIGVLHVKRGGGGVGEGETYTQTDRVKTIPRHPLRGEVISVKNVYIQRPKTV